MIAVVVIVAGSVFVMGARAVAIICAVVIPRAVMAPCAVRDVVCRLFRVLRFVAAVMIAAQGCSVADAEREDDHTRRHCGEQPDEQPTSTPSGRGTSCRCRGTGLSHAVTPFKRGKFGLLRFLGLILNTPCDNPEITLRLTHRLRGKGNSS